MRGHATSRPADTWYTVMRGRLSTATVSAPIGGTQDDLPQRNGRWWDARI
jgi:hypothetical protein